MKVLVTGGAGFLGTHLCEHFRKKNWEVIAYDNLTKYELMRTGYNVEGARDYNLNVLDNLGVQLVVRDVRDVVMLTKVAKGCDFIIHTAAQPAMTIALESPLIDFYINAKGTLNILEAAREYGIPVVNCSTIHMYGNGINESLVGTGDRFTRDPIGIDENQELLTGLITPLHASKRTAEIYVRTYAESYGLRAATFRLTGMYGPRQFGGEDHGWVANFAIRTVLGLPIKVFDTDKQVRDILYVTDAVRAFDMWLQAGCPSGVYNIGGGSSTITSLGDCLHILSEITGLTQDITILPPRLGDLYYFCCDTTLARNMFGWAPSFLPERGIRILGNWIMKNKEMFSK